MRTVLATAFVLTLAVATSDHPARAQASRAQQFAPAFAEIDQLMKTFAEQQHVPGIAYGVLVDGALVHTGAVGVRDIAGKAPVDHDTVFRIASMTKSFTAMCILKLRDEGKLSLDDPAERYVPELAGLKYPTTDSPKITIRHLLSHSTGFPGRQPVGRSAAVDDRRRVHRDARGGHPVFERARHRLRVLQLRLRDSRPHRDAACRACRTRTT